MTILALIGAVLYAILSVALMALVLYSLWWTIQDQIQRQREKYEHDAANEEVER
jgi:hypothetical protein